MWKYLPDQPEKTTEEALAQTKDEVPSKIITKEETLDDKAVDENGSLKGSMLFQNLL